MSKVIRSQTEADERCSGCAALIGEPHGQLNGVFCPTERQSLNDIWLTRAFERASAQHDLILKDHKSRPDQRDRHIAETSNCILIKTSIGGRTMLVSTIDAVDRTITHTWRGA